MELEEAIRRVRKGDVDAYLHVVRALEGPVRSFVVCRCPPGGDADDVAQRTFIAAFRSIDQYRAGSDFKAWMLTIARFQLLAESTRLRRIADYHQRLCPPSLVDALDRRMEQGAECEGRIGHLKTCLQSLDAPLRDLLAQRYEAELSIGDIARNTGRSAGAIKKHLFFLRARLHDCILSKIAAEAR